MARPLAAALAAIGFLVVVVAVAAGGAVRADDGDKTFPLPLIVAHRGASYDAPENTMAAFTLAMQQKADGIETDLRLSSDGVVVLIHDAWLNRTSNGTGLVANFTFAELETLDVGGWKAPQYAGQRIPSLEQLIQEILLPNPNVFVVMDLKIEGLAPAVALLAAQYNVSDRLIASCWTDTQLADFSAALPTSPRQQLGVAPTPPLAASWFSDAATRGVEGFSLAYSSLSAEFVRAAAARLMPTFVWTVNDPAQLADAALRLDIAGVITDRPGFARDSLTDSLAIPASGGDNGGGGHHDKHTGVAGGGRLAGWLAAIIILVAALAGFLFGAAAVFVAQRAVIYYQKRKKNHYENL